MNVYGSCSLPTVKYRPAYRVPVRISGRSSRRQASRYSASVMTRAPVVNEQTIVPRRTGSTAKQPLPKRADGRTAVRMNSMGAGLLGSGYRPCGGWFCNRIDKETRRGGDKE